MSLTRVEEVVSVACKSNNLQIRMRDQHIYSRDMTTYDICPTRSSSEDDETSPGDFALCCTGDGLALLGPMER